MKQKTHLMQTYNFYLLPNCRNYSLYKVVNANFPGGLVHYFHAFLFHTNQISAISHSSYHFLHQKTLV